jgi:hypothetical protein
MLHGGALPGRRFLSRLQEEIRAPPPPPKPEALRCVVSDEDGDPIESLVVPVGAGGHGGGVLGGEAKEGWELEEGSVAEPE